ncbi:MAG TPA: DUF4282 domain-containing protein [Pseudonocardiaceae bacterium]|nr:DUF4282 domain-containing protein [Pseudonocardiaceae bacterium]
MLGLVLIGLSYLNILIFAFSNSAFAGVIALLVGWILPLLWLAFWRVVLEFFLAVVRMAEDIHHRPPQSR